MLKVRILIYRPGAGACAGVGAGAGVTVGEGAGEGAGDSTRASELTMY